MKILIVDQFSGISPHFVQKNGWSFDALCEAALAPENARAVNPSMGVKAEVLDVEENYMPPFCTTTFREGADGKVEVWKYRWDSSG